MKILPLLIKSPITFTSTAKAFLHSGNVAFFHKPFANPQCSATRYSGEKGILSSHIASNEHDWNLARDLAGDLAMGNDFFKTDQRGSGFSTLAKVLHDTGHNRASWQVLLEKNLRHGGETWLHQGGAMLMPQNLDALPWSDEADCLSYDSMDWETPDWPKERMKVTFVFVPGFIRSSHNWMDATAQANAALETWFSSIKDPVRVEEPLWVGTLLGFDLPPF